MSQTINDIELLKNCLKGHTQSFEVLVGRYQSLVCAITYGATGNADKSEELAQETFLLAWKSLRQLKDLAKFKAWLCRIARNVIQNWLRARQRDVVGKATSLENVSPESTAISPMEVAIQQEQQDVVNQAIEIIPEQYRVPLILFYRENKSAREVATIIGINENATRQRIFRARALLKDHVAAMVETTLARSKPGKAFTAGVLVSIAGVSMKGAAAATAAQAVTTGLSALTVKITGIAAGLLVVAGATFMMVNHEDSKPTFPVIQTQAGLISPNEIGSVAQSPLVNVAEPNELFEMATQDNLDTTDVSPQPAPVSEAETLPYEFKPTGVLSGLITDAQTGQPVRDARIHISNNGIGDVRTDQHGFYHVDRIFRPGNCTLCIDSNDYVGFGMNANAPVLNLNENDQVVEHIQLPRACKVQVRVVDVNGVGLAGVRVIPTSLADRATEINDHGLPRRTDLNGYLLLGGFAPLSTDYMITALAQETVRTTSQGNGLFQLETQFTHCPARAIVRLTDPNVTTQVEIVLKRGDTIHGFAEFNDKIPAEGVKIGVQPSWWHCYSSQDLYSVNPDGTFAIPHIVPDTYNIILATTNAEGLPVSSKTIMQKELPLPEDEPLFLHLPIPSPQASVSISGHFVFQGDERPESVIVTATSRKLGQKSRDFQVMSGRRTGQSFCLDGLKPGQYRVAFWSPNIEEKIMEDVTIPCSDLEVELHTIRAPKFQGFVMDQATDEPVTHFEIRLRKIKTLRGSNAIPAKNWITFNQTEGDFCLDTAGPGIYQVQVVADGYAPRWSDPINTDENQVTVVSMSPGCTMTGRIVNQAGNPVNDAKVIPLSWASDSHPITQFLFANERGATHTKNGFFTLSHLPEGDEALQIKHPDYAVEIVRDIHIQVGQMTSINDIVLSSGGSVEGYVLDEHDNPLPNQTLSFCDAQTGTTDDTSRRWATVVTDANGFYVAHHLPTKLCYVYQTKLWRMRGVINRAVTPQEGKTIRLDFGGAFKVRGIIEAQNEPIPQRRVTLRSALRSYFECFTMTDDAGFFTLSGIVPDTYELAYQMPNSQTRWHEVAVVTVVDQDLDLGVFDEKEPSSQASDVTSLVEISSEPTLRHLTLKLPLLQPQFHWTFMSRADTLAGKLCLRIKRGQESTDIVIFEKGQISEGWQALELPENPKAGELYFGFQSTQPYLTAPDDSLELEWHVVRDLDGIGAVQTGVLPAGFYKAQGIYAKLTDEYVVPDMFKTMPQETIDKLRKMVEFRGFLEDWLPKWPLEITGEDGWLNPEQRKIFERVLQQAQEMGEVRQ